MSDVNSGLKVKFNLTANKLDFIMLNISLLLSVINTDVIDLKLDKSVIKLIFLFIQLRKLERDICFIVFRQDFEQ